jgi:hypothetical protein
MTQVNKPEDAPVAFQVAWNSHDMAAFGALFHGDATFVNRFAHYVRGVDDIVALHRPIHETIYSDSTLENAGLNARVWRSVVSARGRRAKVRDGPFLRIGFRSDSGLQRVSQINLGLPKPGAPA